MQSYLLFKAKNLEYAISLETMEHIMVVPQLTPNADGSAISAGMMDYNGDVIEVYSFREMINMDSSYKETLEMFDELKAQHKAWIDALDESVHKGVKFSKTTNPHACHLVKWIDNFTSYNDEVNRVLKSLKSHHANLHKSAINVLELYEDSRQDAIDWVEDHVKDIYKQTIGYLDEMASHSQQVSNDSQKLLILHDENEIYGIKVDFVDNIVHVDESNIIENESIKRQDRYMDISGVLKYEDRLISIISQFKLKEQ